ncbi:site-specific DNA-methyltransferase [Anaerococcus murdochii]|uniref:Site-specific DNA-methyltransferase n=2 Tax=Anaerococcus murdochii TaxID=411577 RepID=A0ABS7SYJ0_9FIRM|nr:site-specific DNA-methyltransferase [Anaerococcus murdochii]
MDLLGADLDKFAGLFPDLVTEERDETGRLKKSIDFEKFKARFSADIISEGKERYEFTWPGKRAAMAEANSPINKTLRPVVEESKNWDTTENLYIEGDNLEVLKLLQESYLGKIKMIYIDPPYNTGSDFVYNDDFKENLDQYNEDNADYDEEGGKLIKNIESNGRFHSDWCSMIYPRLKLARNLLTDDGVIFISIDDNEQENLKKICDEVFGEGNFIAQVIWERAFAPVNLKKHFSESHDYILVYTRNLEQTVSNGLKRTGEADDRYRNPDNDPRGPWQSGDFSVGPAVEANIYEIISPSGRVNLPPNGRSWRVSEEKFKQMVKNNEVWFGSDGNGVPRQKRFLSNVKKGITPMTIWKYQDVGHSQDATKKLKALFDNHMYFEYPKSVDLIKRCIQLYSQEDSLNLDFFSGSATTAHAVMDLNAEDGGHRKYIMVNLPEETDENSEAYKAGYKNICEIGKERIRRAGEKILADNKDKEGIENLDTGFRVFRVDSTNMNDVAIEPNLLEQNFLDEYESNIKADRTDLDLLFACLLAWGLPLDRKHESEDYHGFTIHSYNDGDLIACFDDNISEEAIKYMAKKEPLRVVFRDSCFKSSQDKINVEEIFKIFSPETEIRVL